MLSENWRTSCTRNVQAMLSKSNPRSKKASAKTYSLLLAQLRSQRPRYRNNTKNKTVGQCTVKSSKLPKYNLHLCTSLHLASLGAVDIHFPILPHLLCISTRKWRSQPVQARWSHTFCRAGTHGSAQWLAGKHAWTGNGKRLSGPESAWLSEEGKNDQNPMLLHRRNTGG